MYCQRSAGHIALTSSARCSHQASAVLVTSLRRCLAADVFLRPLADKFMRLALQLVARYAGWLGSGSRRPTDGGADDQQACGIPRRLPAGKPVSDCRL
jgi:hypothetical protein